MNLAGITTLFNPQHIRRGADLGAAERAVMGQQREAPPAELGAAAQYDREIADLVRELASTPERPAHIEVASPHFARGGDRPYFGSIPDFGKPGDGYAISGVSKESPAARGGLQGGDRIVRLGESAIANLEDFDSALRKHKGGETVPVVVIRDGQEVSLEVTLDPPR